MTVITKNHVAPVTKATDYYSRCKNLGGPADFWAGYSGEISTRLYGCGHALIDIGNCENWGDTHQPQIYTDGKFIGNVNGRTRSKVFNFAFKDGSVLKLKPNHAILRFNNFEVIDCNCEN